MTQTKMDTVLKVFFAVFIFSILITSTIKVAVAESEIEDEEDDTEDEDRWDISRDFEDQEDENESIDDEKETEDEIEEEIEEEDNEYEDSYWNVTSSNNSSTTSATGITLTQVQTHNTKTDCWVIIQNKVYDITPLVSNHPGGDVFQCGKDNTQVYVGQHGSSTSRMASYYKGNLVSQTTKKNTTTTNNSSSTSTSGIALAQVQVHNKNTDCWVIIQNKVYDITPLINTHSGGNVFQCGKDNTQLYLGQHGSSTSRIASYYKGNLVSQTTKTQTITTKNATTTTTKTVEEETEKNDDSFSQKGEDNSDQENTQTNSMSVDDRAKDNIKGAESIQNDRSIFTRFFEWLVNLFRAV